MDSAIIWNLRSPQTRGVKTTGSRTSTKASSMASQWSTYQTRTNR